MLPISEILMLLMLMVVPLAPAAPVAAALNYGLTPDQILEMLEVLPEGAEFNLSAKVDDDDEAEADEDMEDVDFGVI